MPASNAPKSLVFSHANGFPAGTYRVLFERWRAAGWQVFALDRFGHDPAYPVTSNWPRLRDQLIRFIDEHVPATARPPVLVGHSLGGLVSVLAASRRPDLARGLVLLDSPIVTGWRAHSVRAVKAARLIQRVSPGRVSQRRRCEWPSREAVHQHFEGKSVFARWDRRVLADYVASGFVDEPDGRTVLAFKREIETRIYNTLPHHLGPLLKRHPLRCPVAFIAGMQSAEMRQGGFEASRALARERFVRTDGTHLYPMEKPDWTADEVLRLAASF